MNVQELYDDLTRDAGLKLISATSVERFIRAPINFWCEVNAPTEEKEPLDPYRQRLFSQGNAYQNQVIQESYPGTVQVPFLNEDEGLRRTLELMAQGASAISNMPLLSRPDGVAGRPDVLVRDDTQGSNLGNFGYQVVEIKAVRKITRGHILQAAMYNRLLGRVLGHESPEFYLLNLEGTMQTVQMAEVAAELDWALDEMRQILAGKPVEPCYGGADWPWTDYVNQQAIAARDVSLVPGLGESKRKAFASAGYTTVETLAGAKPEALTSIKGVGAINAGRFLTSAQAICQDRPVPRSTEWRLPQCTVEVFLDLEGADSGLDSEGPGREGTGWVNYLIGNVIRWPGRPATYKPFFAANFEQEGLILGEFFQWAGTLEDARFYHWHHYEKTHLTRMASSHGLEPALVSRVLDRLVDLSPITTGAFAFPTYSEGLKDIAKYLGFTWRQEDVSGQSSMALYQEYVESGGTDDKTRQKLLDYNEDDCRATLHIFDWLTGERADE
ncbi:MAG: TM0106 family RecB-like putative nuclease [Chloroflexi bacterium]|nr:TM0106 family RecB-like putative nuclease [Chloroflexota bacterium]